MRAAPRRPEGSSPVHRASDAGGTDDHETEHVAQPAVERVEQRRGAEAVEGGEYQHDDGEDDGVALHAIIAGVEAPLEEAEDQVRDDEGQGHPDDGEHVSPW